MSTTKKNTKNKICEFEAVDLAHTYPKWNSPLLSSDYDFIQTHKKLIAVTENLKRKKQEAEFHRIELDAKWDDLKKRQHEFKQDIIKYNDFYVENENKYSRVNQKMQNELDYHAKTKKEIEELQNRLEYLKSVEKDMEKAVDQLKPFSTFMEAIAEKTEFENVKNMINYYRTLRATEESLSKKFRFLLSEKEKWHTNMTSVVKNAAVDLVQLNNETCKLEKVEQLREIMENEIEQKEKNAKILLEQNTKKEVMIKQSYNNLYQNLCKWKKISLIDCNEEQKYNFIRNSLQELEAVVRLVRAAASKKKFSCEVDSSFISV